MSAVKPDHVDEILVVTRDWPVGQRLALAQRLLGAIETELTGLAKPKKPLSTLIGILKLDGPLPANGDWKKIRDEELCKKHAS